jgi:hypothetical protein
VYYFIQIKKRGDFTRWFENMMDASVAIRFCLPIGIGMLIPKQPDQESI